jgi:uncharacterized protein (DUF697 family)/tellurite resistance protein
MQQTLLSGSAVRAGSASRSGPALAPALYHGDMQPTVNEQRAVVTVCLMAAFADGAKSEVEREQIRRIAEGLGAGAELDLAGIYQDVLLRRASLDQAASAVSQPETRQLAYEMAVCVCDADGARGEAETEFLERLRTALGLEAGAAQGFAQAADQLAETPIAAPAVNRAEVDSMVLNYSILNGALELLPQSLASMAILPLQMKMVYRIGKAHGYELDRGHIKDFAATLGIGFTGQYVEQMGRKLMGGLLGQLAGGIAGRKVGALLKGIGGAATGMAFSFATTYALGMVAAEYYGSGRTMSMDVLKRAFDAMFNRGQGLASQHSGAILERARTLDAAEIARLVQQS